MTDKLVLEPTAEHPITIEPNPKRVIVTAGGRQIADTSAALTLREGNYAPVFYIPLADVDESELVRTDHSSYCPYKGDASYYSAPAAGDAGENAVWEYQEPYAAVAEIKDHVAFYADRVEITEQS
jgi:uncharacterized protein (DUF427 family)